MERRVFLQDCTEVDRNNLWSNMTTVKFIEFETELRSKSLCRCQSNSICKESDPKSICTALAFKHLETLNT